MPSFVLRLGHLSVELPLGLSYLGRSGDCLITLDQGLVSRRHARLEVDADSVHLEDLGSINGTFVNDVMVTGRRRLQLNDRILIGNEQLVLLSADGRRSTATLSRVNLLPATPRPAGSLPPDATTLVANPEQADLKRRSMGFFLGELVEKAISMARFDEALRLLVALIASLNRLEPLSPETGVAIAGLVDLAIRASEASGQWVAVDRVFQAAAARGWPLPDILFAAVERLARRLERLQGPGVTAYLALLESGGVPSKAPADRIARLRRLLEGPPGPGGAPR